MNQIFDVFKLLSDETRLRIIHLLHQEDFCVCQLTGILNISQPKASKALSKLRDLKLVVVTRQDKYIYYRLNDQSALLIHILDYLSEHQESYPMLSEDLSRISMKTTLLSNCQNSK